MGMKDVVVPLPPEKWEGTLLELAWESGFTGGVRYVLDLIGEETGSCTYGDAYAGAIQNVDEFARKGLKEKFLEGLQKSFTESNQDPEE